MLIDELPEDIIRLIISKLSMIDVLSIKCINIRFNVISEQYIKDNIKRYNNGITIFHDKCFIGKFKISDTLNIIHNINTIKNTEPIYYTFIYQYYNNFILPPYAV